MDIEEYLSHFEKFTKDPTLEAMEYIMSKFDNPHKKLKCVHIAGTNGKGSVAEMLNKCAMECGYRVGKFISPHLISFNDGICINNKEITDSEVAEILEPMTNVIDEYNANHEIKVKWFEVITSLAFIYFYKNNCDLAIIETGLGGTTDCTNIITPLVSVITSIGYDHVDILGNTLEEIAGHKAGIIKEGSETVCVNQPEVIDVFKCQCDKKNNKLHVVQKDNITNYSMTKDLQKFNYKDYINIEINLKGKIQTINAAECLETIKILRSKHFMFPENGIRKALKNVVHRARMEKIYDNPTIVFDGGHNENAIKNFKQNLEQYYKNDKKIYIISILKTKDHNTIIEELSSDEEALFCFTNGVEDKPYVPAEDLAEEAKKYISKKNIFVKDIEDAINDVIQNYKDRTVFIVGSFYVYKKVIEALYSNKQ